MLDFKGSYFARNFSLEITSQLGTEDKVVVQLLSAQFGWVRFNSTLKDPSFTFKVAITAQSYRLQIDVDINFTLE
jgi:hypothetical protein